LKLCELGWFNGLYRRIYDVLSVDGMLVDACSIQVLPPDALEFRGTLGYVMGATFKDSNTLWFREQPPSPLTFAHELIHLIEGKDVELEEVYAYNLAALAVLLAEKGIIPPVNPIKLFKVTPAMILEAINRVYGYRFKDLIEYFVFNGVIPGFVEFDGGGYRVREGYGDREVVVVAVSELISGAEYDELMFETIMELLNIAARV